MDSRSSQLQTPAGSDDGRFIGTNVLNGHSCERFAVTFEQEYSTTAIISRFSITFVELDCLNDKFIDALIQDIVRKHLMRVVSMR